MGTHPQNPAYKVSDSPAGGVVQLVDGAIVVAPVAATTAEPTEPAFVYAWSGGTGGNPPSFTIDRPMRVAFEFMTTGWRSGAGLIGRDATVKTISGSAQSVAGTMSTRIFAPNGVHTTLMPCRQVWDLEPGEYRPEFVTAYNGFRGDSNDFARITGHELAPRGRDGEDGADGDPLDLGPLQTRVGAVETALAAVGAPVVPAAVDPASAWSADPGSSTARTGAVPWRPAGQVVTQAEHLALTDLALGALGFDGTPESLALAQRHGAELAERDAIGVLWCHWDPSPAGNDGSGLWLNLRAGWTTHDLPVPPLVTDGGGLRLPDGVGARALTVRLRLRVSIGGVELFATQATDGSGARQVLGFAHVQQTSEGSAWPLQIQPGETWYLHCRGDDSSSADRFEDCIVIIEPGSPLGTRTLADLPTGQPPQPPPLPVVGTSGLGDDGEGIMVLQPVRASEVLDATDTAPGTWLDAAGAAHMAGRVAEAPATWHSGGVLVPIEGAPLTADETWSVWLAVASWVASPPTTMIELRGANGGRFVVTTEYDSGISKGRVRLAYFPEGQAVEMISFDVLIDAGIGLAGHGIAITCASRGADGMAAIYLARGGVPHEGNAAIFSYDFALSEVVVTPAFVNGPGVGEVRVYRGTSLILNDNGGATPEHLLPTSTQAPAASQELIGKDALAPHLVS